MAEAREVALPSGYDDEFVNPVDEDLHCSICRLPLKEAVQTGICGHRFCRQCLDEHFRRLELNGELLNCPVDRNILIRDADIFADKATKRKILSFIIKCPSNGCQWTGELRSKTDHLTSCPRKIVACTNKNCSETMTRNKLQKHMTTTCAWRILSCTHCSESHPECKTKAHHADCKKFPLNCSQNCGAVIPREKISAHIEKDCPLTIIACPYFDHVGCEAEIQRREVESHLQAAMRLHLDLACVKLGDTQKKFEETTKKLVERVNALEKDMHSKERCESFTWRIDGFSEVLRKAKSGEQTFIESSPFYRYGYKCKLRIHPNGCDSGENTHLTVYLVIMKGEYDTTLTWPFDKKFTFTLIDQQENEHDRENIVKSCTSNPKKRSFARSVKEQNIGWGFAESVSHEELQKRRYIVDDTIFVHVHFTSVGY
ncbi:unnamed protein product [Porites lobata]|uniref:TNF receptor-associated factor n=1 Tax=Porites lobata TaxID=104759 RepID=A0ABN8NVG2_9CNID|nr:unnamed protein product [Porites lobata]